MAKLRDLDPAWLAQRASQCSDHEIGAELGVNGATIRYHRRKHRIPSYTELTGQMKVRGSWQSRRRGTHSQESSDSLCVNYFRHIDAPEKAYWIGVLATDGCVSENARIHLSQTERDSALVDDFARAIGAEMFLRTRTVTHEGYLGDNKTRTMRVVRFTSKEVAADLVREGIMPRKTKDLTLSPCSHIYPAAYLRGCLDGDGSITKINFKLSSGSRAWVEQARELIFLHTGKRLAQYQQVSRDTGKIVYVLQGVRKDQPVLDWLYSEAGGGSFMARKRSRYQDYWVERKSSWWKDKQKSRALVGALPS